MNTLGYAILSIIAGKPCSGYQLGKKLDVLWPAKHSQIYPLLEKLHQNELLTYTLVEQTNKPNKKVFSITNAGLDILKKWSSQPPSSSITRDEFLIKIYSISRLNKHDAEKLIKERIEEREKNLAHYTSTIEDIESHGEELDLSDGNFTHFILFKRLIQLENEEIRWCNWVLRLLKDENRDNYSNR